MNRILTDNDDGRLIEIGVGQVIRVDLRFQGGTGYTWYPYLSKDSVVQLTGTKTADQSQPGMTGGPVLGMWYFTARTAGDTDLTLLLYRVWEGPSKAIKKYSVKLRVIDKRGKP